MIQFSNFEWDLKAVKADGFFAGHGSVFGNTDRANEIVAPGAFAASLAERKAKGRKLPILWQHKHDEPLGVYTRVEEDERGLYVEGNLLVKEVPKAAEVAALIRSGAVDGLSIGYIVREDSFDEKTRTRTLKRVDLLEVSIVSVPANDDARIEQIKSKVAHGGLPTLPEFERLLREAGFSKTQSAVIATRGLAHLLRSESAAPANSSVAPLIEALRGLSLPEI